MNVQPVTVDRETARGLFRKYKEHRHYSTPVDLEIQRTYQLISQGRVVIQALAEIAKAGVGDDHLPKLAIVRANARTCFVNLRHDGGARFTVKRWPRDHETRTYVDLPSGSFPPPQRQRFSAAEAQVPLIPIHLRPQRGLANYHILFEAEWTPIPPKDPLLLRRVGQADLWLVLAAWDLTEIERAVLAGRING
jgi:hypothetical protein